MEKEKKEIGIEKLIELLNEYEIEKEKSEGVNVDAYVEFKWDYNYNRLVRYDETDHWEGDNLYGDTAVAYLISKKFGMVKWLVENDKIDIDKLKFQSDFMFPLWKDFDQMGSEDIEEYSEYESLLMLLSISDTPIDFLCEILK